MRVVINVVFLLFSIDLQIELKYFMNSNFIFAVIYSREINLISHHDQY